MSAEGKVKLDEECTMSSSNNTDCDSKGPANNKSWCTYGKIVWMVGIIDLDTHRLLSLKLVLWPRWIIVGSISAASLPSKRCTLRSSVDLPVLLDPEMIKCSGCHHECFLCAWCYISVVLKCFRQYCVWAKLNKIRIFALV